MTDPVAIDLLQQAADFITTCSASSSPEALLASINTYLSMATPGNSNVTLSKETIDDLAGWAMVLKGWF
jgi:hypothetical protein